jgi:hypothetical protein
MNTKTARIGIFCITAAFPATALYHVAQSHHAALVLSHYFQNRAGNCNLKESFQGEALSRLQFENVNLMKGASQVTRQDEKYSLWNTPLGEFWGTAR